MFELLAKIAVLCCILQG